MPKRKLTLAQKKELDKLNGVVREEEEENENSDEEKMDEPGEVKELPELVKKPSFKPLSATEASGVIIYLCISYLQ